MAEKLRRATPSAALLSTLAGIALGFISIGFLFRSFARPVIGLTTLAVLLLVYFGRVRFRGGVPGGLVAVALGTLLAWITGVAPVGAMPTQSQGLQLPLPVLGELFAAIRGDLLWSYLAVIVPMGMFNVLGSRCRTSSRPRPPATATTPAPRWPSTGSAASPRPRSARASRPRSTSATPAGRRWAPAPATRF